MTTAFAQSVAAASPSAARPPPTPARGELPAELRAALWYGNELGSPIVGVVPTGFSALDAELPGGGWPRRSLVEVLQPQPSTTEWRLLGAAMRQAVARGLDVVVVGPPKQPHAPGLQQIGLDERRLVWLHAERPADRLWVTEQLLRSHAAGVVVAWLPQARQEQIRRLQVSAQASEGLVFLCRPAAAAHEPSAAPLRVQVGFGLDWELHVHILKRRGPSHEGILKLPSIPGQLEPLMTPRLLQPSALLAHRSIEDSHALGSVATRRPVRAVPAH